MVRQQWKDKMDKHIWVIGLIIPKMDMVDINGLMVASMKENINKVRDKVKEGCFIVMDLIMMENGKMVRNMEKANLKMKNST